MILKHTRFDNSLSSYTDLNIKYRLESKIAFFIYDAVNNLLLASAVRKL